MAKTFVIIDDMPVVHTILREAIEKRMELDSGSSAESVGRKGALRGSRSPTY
jgi:hypothetical protein